MPGVVRRILLEEFNSLFSIKEKKLTVEDILEADEAFLTNALIGIKPLSRFNHKIFHLFTLTSRLKEVFHKQKNYI